MDVLLQNKPDTLIETTQSFRWSEIKKHNSQSDCWFVIDQFIYDITPRIKEHPGGNVFTILAGEDAQRCSIQITFKHQKTSYKNS